MRALLMTFGFAALFLVGQRSASGAPADWTALRSGPGSFFGAWLFIPAGRPGIGGLEAPPTLDDQGWPVLPFAVKGGDAGFSPDIKARGTAAFWKRGGVAVLPVEVSAAGRFMLRAGIPRGASVRINGAVVLTAEMGLDIPETVDLPVELEAGIHLVSVHLGRKVKKRWDGRGFVLRLLGSGGEEVSGLRPLLPRRAFEADRIAGLAEAGIKIGWSMERPAWQVSLIFGQNLPEELVGASIEFGVSAPHTSGGADKAQVGRCRVAPGARCRESLVWPLGWERGRGRVGPARLWVSSARSEGRVTAATWGRGEAQRELTVADLELSRELRGLASTAAHGPGRDTALWGLQQLDDLLQGLALKPPESARAVRGRMSRDAKAMRAGRDPVEGKSGLHLRAYRSPYDGRYQPYALYVPARRNVEKKLPLVVALHGFRGTPAKICRTVLGGARPKMFVLCPYGYGDTVFRFVGEDDLMRTIDLVQRRFPIDPDRVHLTGVSNGGLAAYEVATHHPDRWASVAVLCALGDIRDFTRIKAGPHNGYERRWLDRVSAAERLTNAHGMDFKIVYGAKDRLPHASVERLVYNLRRAGARVNFTLHEDLGHNVWDTTYEKGAIFKWFARRKRHRDPAKIDYVTRSPRYRGSDGAVILEADWAKGARVQVRWEGLERVRIQTANLASVAIPARPGESPRKVSVEVDGEGHTLEVRPNDRGLIVRREGGAWRVWATEAPPPVSSWPRPRGRVAAADVYGGVDQLRGGPILFVYGSGEASEAPLNRHLAELDRGRWARFVTLETRVVADSEVTPSLLGNHNLVLVGTPAANTLIDRLVPQARALLKAKASGGGDVGLRSIHPHPSAEGLAVVLSTGTTARGVAFSVGLPEILPERVWADEGAVVEPFDILLRGRTLLGHE